MKVRNSGCKEIVLIQGQEQRLCFAGAAVKRYPHVQGVVAARAQEGLEEPSHVEGMEGQQEEIPLIQGKEQRLCFAGAAMKRHPMPKVRETQVRW